jgi:hypothetical protein
VSLEEQGNGSRRRASRTIGAEGVAKMDDRQPSSSSGARGDE